MTTVENKLYVYTPSDDTWDEVDTPVFKFALTTFHSHLVLVGGLKSVPVLHEAAVVLPSNTLWNLPSNDVGGASYWEGEFPPMPTSRYSASAVGLQDHLIVAGGVGDHWLDAVEVYDSCLNIWSSAQPLPKTSYNMKSAIHDGCWYLMGGDLQGKELFYTSLDALVHHSDASQNTSIWVSTLNSPHMHSSLVVFGNQLMSIGGEDAKSSIYAYQQKDQSWHFKGIMLTDVQNASTATFADW